MLFCDRVFLPMQVGSQSEYIVKQYEASTKCKKMEKGVRSMYVAGKVQMTMVEEAAQKGCFVIWQMSPDMWLLELVVAGVKIVAGSDGKLAWRHTPWLGAHAARGGPRPLRRFIQASPKIQAVRKENHLIFTSTAS